jgi:hypothetical protein
MTRSDSRSTKRVTAPLGAPGASRSAPKARASYKQSDADREFIFIIAEAMKVDLGGTVTWKESIGRILKRCHIELVAMTSLSNGRTFDEFIERLFGFLMTKFQKQQMEMAPVVTVLLMIFFTSTWCHTVCYADIARAGGRACVRSFHRPISATSISAIVPYII